MKQVKPVFDKALVRGLDVGPLSVTILALYVMKGFCSYFSTTLVAAVGQAAVTDLRNGLYQHILKQSFAFLGRKNYFRRLWNPSAGGLTEYLVSINAGARSAYASGALAAFDRYPLTGVGLGASGFWIYANLPDRSLTTVPEIARQLDPGSRLYPNPKNLYVRLLAETGLLGLSLYMVFLFASFADALDLLRRGSVWRFLGIAGFFAWLAIALYNVTQDSLASPNIWLIPGMLAGVGDALPSIAAASKPAPDQAP